MTSKRTTNIKSPIVCTEALARLATNMNYQKQRKGKLEQDSSEHTSCGAEMKQKNKNIEILINIS